MWIGPAIIGVLVIVWFACFFFADYRTSHPGALSQPSKRLLKEYAQLPKESQRIDDLKSVLVALDTKHGVLNVNNHFRTSLYPESGFTWYPWNFSRHASCPSCAFKDYHKIHGEIESIKEAIAEQEKALAVSKVQYSLDRLQEIHETLRTEYIIIREVTKELT